MRSGVYRNGRVEGMKPIAEAEGLRGIATGGKPRAIKTIIIRTSWIGLQPGTHSGYPAGAATNGAVSRILISGCLSLRANFRVRGPQIGTQLYPTIPATCRKETLRAILRQAAIDADDFLR